MEFFLDKHSEQGKRQKKTLAHGLEIILIAQPPFLNVFSDAEDGHFSAICEASSLVNLA
jgi:hypothetical protein